MSKSYHIPPPLGKSILLTQNGSVEHTVKSIQRVVKRDFLDLEYLAAYLKESTILATCNLIWLFVRQNIKYVDDLVSYENKGFDSEGEEIEVIKSPAEIWASKSGDCDDFTIFISCILVNLDIKHVYRVTAYPESNGDFCHIYPVAFDENGNEIIIDCVPEIPKFNFEQTYLEKKDFPMKTVEFRGVPVGSDIVTPNLAVLSDVIGVNIEAGTLVEPTPFSIGLAVATIKQIKDLITARDYKNNPEALKELSIISALETVQGNPELLVKGLSEAAQDSIFAEVYLNLYSMLATSTEQADNITASQFFNEQKSMSGLNGIFDFIGEAVKGVDTLFGGARRRQNEDNASKERQLQIDADARAKEAAAAVETARLNKEAAEAAALAEKSKADSASRSLTTTDPNNPAPETKKSWFAKNWIWLVVGTVGLVLIIVLVYYLTKKPKKPLSGTKRRKTRRKLNGTSQSNLSGMRKRPRRPRMKSVKGYMKRRRTSPKRRRAVSGARRRNTKRRARR